MFKTKKGLALLAVLVVALAASIGAYAYFTSSGHGTGSATVGTASTVTFSGQTTPSNLLPGGAPQALDYTVNNGASFAQYIGSVTIAISSITQTTAGAAAGPCTAADFTLVQPTAVPGEIAKGGHVDEAPSGASLAMNETDADQDGCQGATVNLSYTANGS